MTRPGDTADVRRLAPLLLLLAGCGRPPDPEPTPAPASPASTSTSTRPSPERSRAQVVAERNALEEEGRRFEREFNIEQARILSQNSQLVCGGSISTKTSPKRFETDSAQDARVVTTLGGAVLLDRGARDQLPIGTRLQAYRFERGGLRTVLGLLEVYELEEDRAWAFVVRGGSGLGPGVALRSPTYDEEEQKVFVFFRPPSRQAVEATRRLGARVDEKVSIETDFLVLPPGFVEGFDREEDEALRKARQFGVIELDADEAALYLGLSR